MASSSSSSSSGLMKHQVFLSFRGEDTRHNFTSHLLEALKATGMNVFFDEEKLEKGEQLLQALSQAISASNLSLIVLSNDYASSKSCLAELSDIMDHKDSRGHIVLPIFYHVDPSDVRNLGGNFRTSFDHHESKGLDQVQRWKVAFSGVGKLKGWHIEGGKFDRSETEYIKDITKYVLKKLMNSKFRRVSEDLVGIDYQKNMILGLIEQEESRVIGLWGMGGIGKTTLADAVYKEASPNFGSRCFLQNVSEKMKNQGWESLRNEFLSKILNEKEIRIDTLSIEYPYQERLNNKRVIVVLDDVSHPDQIDYMGVKHFGPRSKIIVTSRDRQVLKNGGANRIYEVERLNKVNSLQLFSTFAFKLLNPAVDFRDLSNKFVEYSQGNPLALKVLGSKLYTKSKREWESEVGKLKEYAQPQISQILKSSFDGLDEIEKNIFLDIACFLKWKYRYEVEEILSCLYNGVVCGISNLVDKCLLDNGSCGWISMHDMLEEMGNDIVRQECKDPAKRSRLWSPKDVVQVLKYNKGTDLIEGIKLDMSQIDNLQFSPTIFEKMHNLRYIQFYFPPFSPAIHADQVDYKKLHAAGVDSIYLPDELRYLRWSNYPFKSLSNFNPQNLVVLELPRGGMEQLWNEDDHPDVANLRKIDVSHCKNLRKIPNLLGAINLKSLNCTECRSLVELPCLSHLACLETLQLEGCRNLKKFPEVPTHFSTLYLGQTGIGEVPDSIEHFLGLKTLSLMNSRVKTVSSNISKLKSLECLNLSDCPIAEFPEIPLSLTELHLSGTQIEEVASSFYTLTSLQHLFMSGSSIQKLQCNIALSGSTPTVDVPSSSSMFKSLIGLQLHYCKNLKLLSELPPYRRFLAACGCESLEKVSFADQTLYEFDFLGYDDDVLFMLFANCFSLNQDSVDNIEANAMLNIGSLAKKWSSGYDYDFQPEAVLSLICCFPGNQISANKFEFQSLNSSLNLKIDLNGSSAGRFLFFAICLVADLTHCNRLENLEYICEYQLITASGGNEKFKSELVNEQDFELDMTCTGDHVLILFSKDFVKEDKNYERASFEFHIKNFDYSGEEVKVDGIKVKKCGVHVFYVDAESFTGSDVESKEMLNFDETSDGSFYSAEDANVEEVDDDA